MTEEEDTLKIARFLFLIVLFVALLTILIQVTQADQGETFITQSADSYVDAFSPLSNFGGSDSLYLSFSASAVQVVWVKYDLSTGKPTPIPEGAKIDNATLWVTPVYLTETFQVSVFSCSNNSWGEYTINYLNQPEYSSSPLATLVVPTVNIRYDFDVTDYVKNTFNSVSGPTKEITFVLKQNQGQTGHPLLRLRSREDFTTVVLSVHWSTTASPTSSPTPTPTPIPTSTATPTPTPQPREGIFLSLKDLYVILSVIVIIIVGVALVALKKWRK